MPINDFDGETFVAFTDISGFKDLMKTEDRALKALDTLYQNGYELLRVQNVIGRVEGLFVSDSGVLFMRNVQGNEAQSLRLLLSVIQKLNMRMLADDFMLTTSIAYGQFRYQERIEFVGITKNAIYGNAYVSAFFDNEKALPKIQPGQCRILKSGMPIDLGEQQAANTDGVLDLVRERAQDAKHLYYYWMIENAGDIERFEEHYQNAYDLKFKGMVGALKRYSHHH